MASPSLTTTISNPPSSPKHRSRAGSLSLRSPTESEHSSLPSKVLRDHVGNIYDFRLPSGSRGPCPALNALSNHGYLPRDGHNISAADFLTALEHPDTYNLSRPLANVLVYGGLAMLKKPAPISLHDLALHGRIEHNASMTRKDAVTGDKFAPTRCDTVLLEGLLQDKEFLTLDDIAKRRVLLENATSVDAVHGEIARGEWALVLDVFGKAHGGRVPTSFLHEWLKENRFPEGWKPTHEQGLFDTVAKSKAIRERMNEYRHDDELIGNYVAKDVLERELTPTLEEAEKARKES